MDWLECHLARGEERRGFLIIFIKWKYFDKKYSIEQLSKEYTNSSI